MPIFQRSTPKVPKVSAKVHCKGCYIYENRYRVSQALEEIYGEAGVWDFSSCYLACLLKKEVYKNRLEYNKRKLAHYHQKKLLLKNA